MHHHLSPAEAKQMLSDAHERLLKALGPLSEEELQQPYAAFLPESSGPGPENPIRHYIVGNTFGPLEEHMAYIKTLLKELGESN
jgi:hypothetical protein